MGAPGIHGTAPATRWPDAYLTGNGRHGALVFGDPYDEAVIVTHHSLVLPNGSRDLRAPEMADRLEPVRDLVLAGQAARALERITDGRPTQWGQPFHPAFALRLALDPGEAGGYRDYRRTTDFSTGVVSVQWADAQGPWRRECFVSRADDVVVLCLYPPAGGAQSVATRPSLRYQVRLPGAPDGLGVREIRPSSPELATGTTGVQVTYPSRDGECPGYVGVTRAVVTPEQVLLLTRVARADPGGGSDLGRLFEDGEQGLAGLPADYALLLDRHLRRHRAAYERVSLELETDPTDQDLPVAQLLARGPTAGLLQKLFEAGRYHLLSASGVRPPRLVGLWQGDWDAAWGAGFTLNANLNLQLAGAVSGDLPEAVHAVAGLVHDQLDDWRANARRLFGTRGIVAPTHTDGENGAAFHFSAQWPLQLWTAGADWLLVTLLDHVQSRGDEAFGRERVLPLLLELALFYEDFLTRRDAAGQLVFVPSYSPENAPLGGVPITVNATMDVAAARHALTAAITAFAASTDEPERAAEVSRWRARLDALPPYRINADGALAEWAWPGTADDYDHRHVSHLYPVWPLHEISPQATPELAAAALRALRLRGHENDSAHGYLHQALVAARLREPALVDDLLTEFLRRDFCFDNLMTSHYPGREVFNADASCALPGLLIEALVDAEPGRVELLPAVPASMPAGRLRGVRTVARVTVLELRWHLGPGSVEAVLRSDRAQPVMLVCAGETRTVEFAAHTPLSVTVTGDGGGMMIELWPPIAPTRPRRRYAW
jgi:alpha-L-fucosidase 2